MRLIPILFLLALCLPVTANAADTITVHAPYALATAPSQKSGAVFMAVGNTGPDDRITGASAEIAERTELHTNLMHSDMMMMRAAEGFNLPKGGQAVLEPAGQHIMLMGLKKPLKAGTHFPLTLSFAHHAPVTVEIAVRNVTGQ